MTQVRNSTSRSKTGRPVTGPGGRQVGVLVFARPRRGRIGWGGIACYVYCGDDGGSYLRQAWTVPGGRKMVRRAAAARTPAPTASRTTGAGRTPCAIHRDGHLYGCPVTAWSPPAARRRR